MPHDQDLSESKTNCQSLVFCSLCCRHLTILQELRSFISTRLIRVESTTIYQGLRCLESDIMLALWTLNRTQKKELSFGQLDYFA